MNHGGNNTMNAMQEQMFLELRQTKDEIESALRAKQRDKWLTVILEEELADINDAIKKLEIGQYGQCEFSGEFLPEDLLKNIPTIKTTKDTKVLAAFCKKPLTYSF